MYNGLKKMWDNDIVFAFTNTEQLKKKNLIKKLDIYIVYIYNL